MIRLFAKKANNLVFSKADKHDFDIQRRCGLRSIVSERPAMRQPYPYDFAKTLDGEWPAGIVYPLIGHLIISNYF